MVYLKYDKNIAWYDRFRGYINLNEYSQYYPKSFFNSAKASIDFIKEFPLVKTYRQKFRYFRDQVDTSLINLVKLTVTRKIIKSNMNVNNTTQWGISHNLCKY